VYMGPLPEKAQEEAIGFLKPYKSRLEELVDRGCVFLFTGNAYEIFLREIVTEQGVPGLNEEGHTVEGLGLFDLTAKRRMMDRYHSLYLGEALDADGKLLGADGKPLAGEEEASQAASGTAEAYAGATGDMKIMGVKAQFSHMYGDNEGCAAFKTLRGDGEHPGAVYEGVRRKNLIGTYLTGPLLISNPPYTKYLLTLMGEEGRPLAFEEAAMAAYEVRLKEYQDPAIEYIE